MNVLIVDDELLIRTSLQLYLESNNIPSGCIFHADNAAGMLKLLKEKRIDIAFVDIRMPGIDGLSAIDSCSTMQLETHFYILTGYSKFEYAHRALQLHIEDYLLKPVSPDQIRAIVQKELNYLQTQADAKRDVYRFVLQQTITDQVTKPVDAHAILVCFSENMNSRNFQQFISRLSQYIESELHLAFIRCSFLCWEYFLIHQKTDLSKLKKYLSGQIEQIPCCMLLRSGSNVPVTLQRIQVESWQLIFARPGRCYTSTENFAAPSKIGYYFANLLYWAGQKNYVRFCLVSRSISASISQAKAFLTDSMCGRFCAVMNSFFAAPHYRSESIDDISDLLESYAADHLLQRQTPDDNLNSIKQYIETHYQETITLPMLAQYFGYTPNYVSYAFRKQFGFTVTQYINQIRLSNACRLLTETNMTIQQISDSVGYSDSNYFARMFTRQYKCAPTLFRKNNSG